MAAVHDLGILTGGGPLISLTTLVVLGLAGYRATQLGVHDSILDPVRQRLGSWHAAKIESKPRALLIQLISCIYCLGWWASGAVLAAWHFWGDNPIIQFGLLWFAVAGAQSLLNRRDDTFGG
ncbi:hypothetical protein DIZ27_32780 [Streptomyces sp. NWU339]|uniref:DUF1360 domain-containing protein n=1 Tax=Streptomyces sp. NWU339 TaxID=2185284 RepID=UPI000D6837E9|nr:DUF1360 domain-containing protein [Streptomyces sp. NWU339]PWI06518.1 hypothetical protein DIZ27_32780 [Streptomyces sp. NWU339]